MIIFGFDKRGQVLHIYIYSGLIKKSRTGTARVFGNLCMSSRYQCVHCKCHQSSSDLLGKSMFQSPITCLHLFFVCSIKVYQSFCQEKYFAHVTYRSLHIYADKTATDKEQVLLKLCMSGVRKLLGTTVNKDISVLTNFFFKCGVRGSGCMPLLENLFRSVSPNAAVIE